MNQPAILPSTPEYRARVAFLRFQHALDSLEQEMKPLEISIECAFELKMIGTVSRSFFKMANDEIFSRAVNSTANAGKERLGIGNQK